MSASLRGGVIDADLADTRARGGAIDAGLADTRARHGVAETFLDFFVPATPQA
jgi:hypothetical protein